MRFSYHAEQWLSHPAVQVFEFFANPGNLSLLMPDWQRAQIEKASILPPPQRPDHANHATAAGVGSRFTLRFRPFPFSPVRLRWEAEITEFSWNHHFCDEQVRGPFAYWKHCHYIRPIRWQGVDAAVLADDIEYEPSFGAVGTLAHRLFLRAQIERSFAYRQSQLNTVLARVKSQSAQSQPE
ncbi:MAG TPA: SRPBCC family protein [Acidobacteriaceae bacterium]